MFLPLQSQTIREIKFNTVLEFNGATIRLVRITVLLTKTYGSVVQLVRIPACHAGGRGFEPRPDRQQVQKSTH